MRAMAHQLKFLNLRRVPIFDQLRLEELLLRNTSINAFLFNRNASVLPHEFDSEQSATPQIILGFSGKPEVLVNLSAAQSDGIPLIRRYSGGGTVLIDDSTIFTTIILNAQSLSRCGGPYPREIMHWTGQYIFSPIFSNFYTSNEIQFAVRENDYVWGHYKFGGNAQSITKGRWAHHTSFLWDYDAEMMEKYLRMPHKQPEYRKRRTHTNFCISMKELISRGKYESSDDVFFTNQRDAQKSGQTNSSHNDDDLELFLRIFQKRCFDCMDEEVNSALRLPPAVEKKQLSEYFLSILEDVADRNRNFFNLGPNDVKLLIESFTRYMRSLDCNKSDFPRTSFIDY